MAVKALWRNVLKCQIIGHQTKNISQHNFHVLSKVCVLGMDRSVRPEVSSQLKMTTMTSDPWSKVSLKYPVHPETKQDTLRGQEMGMKSSSDIPLDEVISQNLRFIMAANGTYAFDGQQTDVIVPSSSSADGIPVSVYKPRSQPAYPAILVYFHGGSLIMGSRKNQERSLQMIAEMSGVIVVNVEYRLLPCLEDPFAPFNDAVHVTQWVLKNKQTVSGSIHSKIGIGGDSAGGQITCSLPDTIKDLDFQVLIYPTVTDLSSRLPSSEEFYNTPGFNTQTLEWRLGITNTPIPDATRNPLVHALCKTNFQGTPPTLMILAQLDPLRDYGFAYTQKLKDAGIKVQEVLIDGVPHGFFSLPGIYKTKTMEAFKPIADFMKTFHG